MWFLEVQGGGGGKKGGGVPSFLSFLEDNKCKCVEEIYTDEEKRIIERII